MRALFAVLLTLALTGSAVAGGDKPFPPAPKDILSDKQFGYAKTAKSDHTKNTVTFMKGAKIVFVLRGAGAKKWMDAKGGPGMCYLHNPAVIGRNTSGKPGIIYRFENGAIVVPGTTDPTK